MSGYPFRIQRSTLGPTFVDNYPVENPETDIGARQFNTAFHQLAGLNTGLFRSWTVAKYNGSLSIQYQGEVWNADGNQAHPVLTRVSTGIYTLTFAASYADETGAMIATSLVFARATTMTDMTSGPDNWGMGLAWIDSVDPLKVNIKLANTSTDPFDVPFLVEVG